MATYFIGMPMIDNEAEGPAVAAALVARTVTVRSVGGSNLNVWIAPVVPDGDEPADLGPIPLAPESESNIAQAITFVLPAGYEVRISKGMGSASCELLVTGV